jgi:hypothetical protein
MKKTTNPEPDLRPEYDFSNGVRGKHARRAKSGSNLVLLEPDVAKAFPDAKSVNTALRALAGIARRQKAAAVKS